ncbi:MAG TPA: hypothetical protein VF832_09045 [Longimicrobiales bacterium]
MKAQAKDWFDRAAPAVLRLEEKELVYLAVPVARLMDKEEERVLSALAALEWHRRKALANPAREAEDYRRSLAHMATETDKYVHAWGYGYGARIAALVAKRPQPKGVTARPAGGVAAPTRSRRT